MSLAPNQHHEHRLSHAERKITELEEELRELKQRNSQMALHCAELEAALLRLDDKTSHHTKWWDYNDVT